MNEPPESTDANVLIGVERVAEKLNVSTRHVRRLTDAGALPRPIRLGSLVRWRLAEIDAWIASGCPRREREGER
ncbi:MAG: helix-turn-helix domain-containing protein [Phycisphaerae bacterium]|nr:helix-turn-helix domain-containing protein [Phycisphaerae bacterium]